MPRDGSHAHNAPELGDDMHNIVHGAGNEPQTDHVARAEKTAPMPEPEHGEAIEGLPASGGHSSGLSQGPTAGQGKGPK
ncbi:hypothetical protein Micbo1qcDRAFT_235422 [Microdochium bolleyi]|uniref:Uncharacterized protein n=1 Tax=Microdochium bolleyi TaxID=196109 RepID=A0A136IVZ7_9PEZI|nr:hypothetical protein Micbo1qcDRAFT_235422 [Microdochium bolleyi]